LSRIRIMPMPGQECVWDYPLPPKLEDSLKQIRVVFNGAVIAETRRAKRVLETGCPQVYFIPPEDVKMEYISATEHTTHCEFKGVALHCKVVVNDKEAEDIGWWHPDPPPDFASIKGYIAFYPSKLDACYIDREKVEAVPGDSCVGWVTKDITGPFKGAASSLGYY